jgi:hypothetical protein
VRGVSSFIGGQSAIPIGRIDDGVNPITSANATSVAIAITAAIDYTMREKRKREITRNDEPGDIVGGRVASITVIIQRSIRDAMRI